MCYQEEESNDRYSGYNRGYYSDIFSDPVELVRMAKGLEIVACIS